MLFTFFIILMAPSIHALSLHDALPIFPCRARGVRAGRHARGLGKRAPGREAAGGGARSKIASPHAAPDRNRRVLPGADRKSTRLNSSHLVISYAVFCLKKKKHIYNRMK